MSSERFDARYYERFYHAPATRIAEPAYFDRLAAFITSYLDLLGCEVGKVLDAGCGAGLLHAGLRRAWPEVEIDAFDVSTYVCKRYGWQHASLETFDTDRVYDLVICHDVLQYLDRRAADAALARFGEFTRSALFFGVLTREDWDLNCDQVRTDGDVHLRGTAWYRRRLRGEFQNAGGGLYVKRDADIVLYSLEAV